MKLFLVMVMLNNPAFLNQPVINTQALFCSGWKEGYVTGYKQEAKTQLDPLVPSCPLTPMRSIVAPKNDYERGYLLGLEEGKKRAK